MLPILINALRETLYMVMYATLISVLVGVPTGMFIASLANSKNGLARGLYAVSFTTLQSIKAIPYILVMLIFIPITNWLINHQISFTTATIAPLSLAGSLLLAQAVYDNFMALNKKWQSTIKAMGASNKQFMFLILLPESFRGIVEACANTAATIVGFSIVAGAFGAGGLGQLAIERTITEPNATLAILSIVALIAIQQLFKYTAILLLPQKS